MRQSNPSMSFSNATVIVAALGYFVDIFDTVLFGMLRVQSLESLGFQGDAIEKVGMMIDNWQLLGLMLGGIIWGILGDKLGRMKVLFGSIALYSLATIACGFIQDSTTYAGLRFIAGLGLAGELGAGVTLVNELLSKEKRGLATAFVAVIGIMGAVVAGVVVKAVSDWRIVYYIGGLMGFALFVARFSVRESSLFLKAKKETANMGDFFLLFRNKQLFIRYISMIAICLPIGYVIQLYAKFSPELAIYMGMTEKLDYKLATNSMMIIYFGMGIGDIFSGVLSNRVKSRKSVIRLFLSGLVFGLILFWLVAFSSYYSYYLMVFILGFLIGFWALCISLTAESFGTNLRATVTTSVPNLLRGFVIIINISFLFLSTQLHWGAKNAMILMAIIFVALAFIALQNIPESFGKDLDYLDE